MQGHIMIVDVLGFSNIIQNLSDADLSSRINEWVTLTARAAESTSIDRFSMLSDTVFAATDASEKGLVALITMARILLNEGIQLSLPVRGAIAYGSFTWGELTYGKAVIEAHQLESEQNWIGISCAASVGLISTCWGYDSLICYPIPLKNGQVSLGAVVSWDVPEYERLVSLAARKGLKKPHEAIHWPWANRIDNTTAFSIYKNILIKGKQDPSHFHGFSPMQGIEMYINEITQSLQRMQHEPHD